MLRLVCSFALPILSGVAVYLVGHGHPRLGWWLLLAAQVPWAAYDVWTGQYGFFMTVLMSGGTSLSALHRMRRAKHSGR